MIYPDKWAIVKISQSNDTSPLYKILAGFYGGYAGADGWRLNSGIKSFEKEGDRWIFYGYSGSVYSCHENSNGFNTASLGFYLQYKDKFDIVDIEELKNTIFGEDNGH